MTHWVYGSGMSGCMFDNGPHITETEAQAIDGVLFPFFDDMTREQAEQARTDLQDGGIHYLPSGMGADLVEVSECECTNPDHLGELEQ